MKLLTNPDQQPKTAKGLKHMVMTWALHLAPAELSGHNVCPMATEGCKKACLNSAGRGRFDNVQRARIARTTYYFDNRAAFMERLAHEIKNAIALAIRKGYVPAFRLNATSDIPWERVPVNGHANIMAMFPNARFYDYTKITKRALGKRPANYALTYSLSENNLPDAMQVLKQGGTVAVVVRDKTMQASLVERGSWLTFPTMSGDEHDARFIDPPRHWIVLYAKGRARNDKSGFVKDIDARLAA